MKIDIDIQDGESGNWKIETFTITQKDADFFNMRNPRRSVSAGSYKRLRRNNQVIMSNTEAEIDDHMRFINTAKEGGHILINGLGLGVALKSILESDKVLSVTIIEQSKDVISLVAKHYESDSRVNIIHEDAFTYKPPKNMRYSAVWHDIWDYICEDNLPEMSKLHRKYGRRTDWQGSWAKELCKRY